MTRTYVDAGVRIAAARGTDAVSGSAMQVLDDPDREFASSAFVRLEVLPKARYHGQREEAAFYDAFFESVGAWPEDLNAVVQDAHRIADGHGLAALDALHVAAALAVGAEELVTSERPEKPIYRVAELRVVSVRSLVSP
jgi:predicted nucleic acid-binding protein